MSTELRQKFVHIFTKVQKSSSCHQKYVKILTDIYNDATLEDFVEEFMKCMRVFFKQPMTNAANPPLDKGLSFAGLFVSNLAMQHEKETTVDDSDEETHPLLAAIIKETLRHHSLGEHEIRFNSCKFLMRLMNKFGSCLDADLCDDIEKAMLERIWDPKTLIRTQAIAVLTRLQDPMRIDCPVMQAILQCFYDAIASVRKAAVESIAYTAASIDKIIERLGDVDNTVRLAAMKKFTKIDIKNLKMIQRQHILLRGFSESNKLVRQVFFGLIIPNWLAACEQNFVNLFKAVILDAFESDVKQSALICEDLMKYFLEHYDTVTIIESLTVNENHLVPLEMLNLETMLYWSGLVEHFRKKEENQVYLEQILPELTGFCTYIQDFLKMHSQKELHKYERIQFEFIFLKLLEIAKNFDLGDEAGRRNLNSLMLSLLKENFSCKIVEKMTQVLSETIDDTNELISELCTIMTDVNEPVEEKNVSQVDEREIQFETARLNVQLNILNEKLEEELEDKKYEEAASTRNDITKIQEQIKNLAAKLISSKMEKPQNDVDAICHNLRILYSLMLLPRVKMCDSLRTCKDIYVIPNLTNFNTKVMLEVTKCIGLFGLLDKQVAKDHVKRLFTHLITFRLHRDISIEIILINIITDFIRLYGVEILKNSEDNEVNEPNRRLRHLCQIEQLDDVNSLDFATLEIDDILSLLLEMCDDEDVQLKKCAGIALVKLMADGRFATPTMMSRILLKWMNPLTEKEDPSMVQLLGVGIDSYTTRNIKDSAEVMENAVIPTLKAIANAPHTSPLLDIDNDRAINFLCALTSIKENSNSHKNLLHSLCYNISLRPDDPAVVLFTKMLIRLDVPDDQLTKNELLARANSLIDIVQNKMALRNIGKLIEKLQKNPKTVEQTNNGASTSGNTEKIRQNDKKQQKPLPVIVENQLLSESPIEFSSSPSDAIREKDSSDSPIEFSESPTESNTQKADFNRAAQTEFVLKQATVKLIDCVRTLRKRGRLTLINKNTENLQESDSSKCNSPQNKKKKRHQQTTSGSSSSENSEVFMSTNNNESTRTKRVSSRLQKSKQTQSTADRTSQLLISSDSQESIASTSSNERLKKKAKLSVSQKTSTTSDKDSNSSQLSTEGKQKKKKKKRHRKNTSLQNCSCTVDYIFDSGSESSLSSSFIPSSQPTLDSDRELKKPRKPRKSTTRKSQRLRKSAKRSSSGRLSDVEKVTIKKKKQ